VSFVADAEQHSGAARPAAVDHRPLAHFNEDESPSIDDEARSPERDGTKESSLVIRSKAAHAAPNA